MRSSSSPTFTEFSATFCPADKKIIHGMKDAALIPCVEVESSAAWFLILGLSFFIYLENT